MLGQRVITALVLLFLLFLIVFFTNALSFLLIFSVVTLIAVWEWAKLSGLKETWSRCLYCFAMSLLAVLSYFLLQEYLPTILVLNLFFWFLAFILILTYPKFILIWNNSFSIGLIGVFVLLPCWLVLNFLRSQDDFSYIFISLIALIAAADSGAYFIGKRFGKHKLAKLVSPNKTWEGVLGGVLSCFILILVITFTTGAILPQLSQWQLLFVLPILISFFSVIGDLFESMLKRVRGVKDSGNILPGHGGILDRIDGIVSTMPAFTLMLVYFT